MLGVEGGRERMLSSKGLVARGRGYMGWIRSKEMLYKIIDIKDKFKVIY